MQKPVSMMFEDDDGVEPQFNVVDKYYFEQSEDEPVCFSILPLHFDNNEEVVDSNSGKKVYLRGVLDQSQCPVHKRVVAWRVELDYEHPKIFVLSSEGNWVTILRPRKCYKEKIARSILITVQMLHFIKKQPGDKSRLLGQLWDHLYEVFDTLDNKPNVDDLREHHPLIKLVVERDPALIRSKILQRLIEDTTAKMKQPKTPSTKAQFIANVESCSSKKENDDKNDYDYSYNELDTDDEYSYSESSSEDYYSYSEDNNGSDADTDNEDSGNEDSTDEICAICDDGGKLLSCIGHCKRSFHPRVRDGREPKCITLGYTSAQLKGISDFLCQNCKYKQHQCFKCGELEPSDELNAKVFKCNSASCGHFYHPKCVAKLLEPDDGSCELAKRIMSGMSFTCPVHWCFKCGKMEDKTQRELQFGVCRLCPKSYHRGCLPRNISFKSKGKRIKQRAWTLSNNILIYCRDHRIYRTTGTAGRNHIKFPCVPEVSKTNYPVTKNSSCAMGGQLKSRVTSKADQETSSGISHDIARKCVMPSTLGLYGRTDQDILSGNTPVEDTEWVGIAGDKDDCERDRTSTCNDGVENGTLNKRFHENHEQNGVLDSLFVEKQAEMEGSELKSIKEGGMERGNNAYEHDSVSGQEKDISTCEQDSGSRKGKITSNYSNQCGSGSKVTPDHIGDHPPQKPLNVAHVEKVTITSITDTQPEYGCGEDREINGSYDCQVERYNSQSNDNPKTVDIDTAGDKLRRRETKEKATDGNKVDLNKIRKFCQIDNGSEDPCEDRGPLHAEVCSENQILANHKKVDVLDSKLKGRELDSPRYNDENTSADISKYKSKNRTVPNRRDETTCVIRANSSDSCVGRNAQKRLRSYSPGQEMYHRVSYPETSNRHRYEHYDYVDGRQRNPRQSAFSPDFGAGRRWSPPYLGRQEHGIARRCGRRGPEYVPNRRHSSPSCRRTPEHDEYRHSRSHVCPPYTRRPEYGSNRRHTPPIHPRSPDIHPHQRMAGYGRSPNIHPQGTMAEYGTSRRYSTSHGPRSEDVDYTLDWNSSLRLHYYQYDNYGRYSEMHIDPVARYSSGDKNDSAYRPGIDLNVEERVAMYGGPVSDYGEVSLIPKASGSVTDKYAPRLDQTNHQPIDRRSRHFDLSPVRWW